MSQVPPYDELIQPLFQALKELGGSGSIEEIEEKVAQILSLPEGVTAIRHNPEKSNQTEFGYRLAWARTYLKNFGLIENSARGVWAIAADKRHIETIDAHEVVRVVREAMKVQRAAQVQVNVPSTDEPEVVAE